MDFLKYQEFLEKLLNLNLSIESNIFKVAKFIDEDIELKFQNDKYSKEKYQVILGDIILICGYVASLIYIFFAFYKPPFLIICSISFTLSLFLIILSYIIKKQKIKYIFDNLEILLISLSLNIKGNLLNFYYNTPENDNYAEIVRIIIYDFVAGNLFVLMKLEANIYVNFVYFFLNLFLIITSTIYSNTNHFYFLEGFTSFLFTLIFFFFRRTWDQRMRIIFAEKYKIEKLLKYTMDFIIGLNAFHINIKNNDVIYSDEKLMKLLDDLSKKHDDFKSFKLISNKTNYETIFSETNNNLSPQKNQSSIDLSGTGSWLIDSEKNYFSKNFMKFLYEYSEENDESKSGDDESPIEKQKKENKDKDPQNIDSIITNPVFIKNERKRIKPKSKFSIKENKFFQTNEKSLFSHLSKLRIQEMSNEIISNNNIQSTTNEKYLQTGLSNNYTNIGNNSTQKNLIGIRSEKILNVDVPKADEEVSDLKKGKNLKENFEKKDQIEFDKSEKSDLLNNQFLNMGIYCFKNPEIKKYYEVFYRKIKIDKTNYVYDILFYDISELINSKKIITEENRIKQKVLAKIAHEFKTPINSIIGLINNLKENLSESNEFENISIFSQRNSISNVSQLSKINDKLEDIKIVNKSSKIMNPTKIKNLKILDIIQNLSKYIIFLVSDIIQYSSIKDINQINLSYDKVKMNEIANFSLQILKCLLKCNKTKYENIKTEMKFEQEIDKIIVKIDEIRLKQIILNIISNAVKFTKCGKIKIKFKIEDNFKNIIISISDSGIGIKDTDKEKLFKDFVMLGDGVNLNNQGTGLGLSICKSLAYKMNIKLNFNSRYGEGTKFYILIPIKNEFHKSCKNLPKISKMLEKENGCHDSGQIIIPSLSSRIVSNKTSNKLMKYVKRNITIERDQIKFKSIDDKCLNQNVLNLSKQEKSKLKSDNSKNNNIQIIDFEEDNMNKDMHSDSSLFTSRNASLIDLQKINQCYESFDQSIEKNEEIFHNHNSIDNNNENDYITNDIKSSSRVLLIAGEKTQNFNENNTSKKKINFNNITINYNINNNMGLHSIKQLGNNGKKNFDLIQNKILKTDYGEKKHTNQESIENKYLHHEKDKQKKPKIMIVDDNQFINDSLLKLMEKVMKEANKDFEILQITDGIDMIKKIIDDQSSGNLIKCVLTDENMEYINGSEAIKILRNMEKKNKIKHIKILSISCQEDNFSVKMMLDSGADLVLGKPISKNVIFSSLKDLKII